MKITFEDGLSTVEWVIPVGVHDKLVLMDDLSCSLEAEVELIQAQSALLMDYLTKPQKFDKFPKDTMPNPVRAIIALLCQAGTHSINSILESDD